MAFRIKEYLRKNRYFIVTSLILTLVIMFPYITRRFTPVEHDTFFHLSRIEQLSKSIRNGQFLPAHYPEENFGFGYASGYRINAALQYFTALAKEDALRYLHFSPPETGSAAF